MTTTPRAKRGRKPLDISVAERAERVRAQRASSKAKTRNLTVDFDLIELVNSFCDSLEGEFGFRPTISQAMRVMILRASK